MSGGEAPTSNIQHPTSSLTKRPALALIRWYQRHISAGLAGSCRFHPTCSQYTYEAVESYGALRGIAMGAWRILRCNPLNDGGYDPVPERAKPTEGPSQA
jgi:putative membrane protein insertion efficiency factor